MMSEFNPSLVYSRFSVDSHRCFSHHAPPLVCDLAPGRCRVRMKFRSTFEPSNVDRCLISTRYRPGINHPQAFVHSLDIASRSLYRPYAFVDCSCSICITHQFLEAWRWRNDTKRWYVLLSDAWAFKQSKDITCWLWYRSFISKRKAVRFSTLSCLDQIVDIYQLYQSESCRWEPPAWLWPGKIGIDSVLLLQAYLGQHSFLLLGRLTVHTILGLFIDTSVKSKEM